MEKIKLSKDIIVYQFEANSDSLIGVNITAVFNGKDYLLIDAGYQHHIKEVLEDLQGFTCTHVINTHYHPDHTFGLYELGEVIKIGSKNSFISLEQFDLAKEKQLYPTIEVDNYMEYKFGNHKFTMTKNIGHSICGILINMDDEYIFVGDDIIANNEGEAVFPYLTLEDINFPKTSLERIQDKVLGKTLIPAHGKILSNHEEINNELDKRRTYYKYVSENTKLNDFEVATGIHFIGRKGWHKHNTNTTKKQS